MKTERKLISKWNKRAKDSNGNYVNMEQVVYITTYDDGSRRSETKHEPVKS